MQNFIDPTTYECLGFQGFQDRPERMFITMGTIRAMFDQP